MRDSSLEPAECSMMSPSPRCPPWQNFTPRSPALSPRQLYRSAVTIGRDHISSTVNTLLLAYAGAALPLLLLFTQANQSVGSLAGREVIATEIIRSLVGSIGLVSAVAITTYMSTRPDRSNPKGAAEQHLDPLDPAAYHHRTTPTTTCRSQRPRR